MSSPESIPRYPVRLVASRTGLSPHVLRAWERRHGVVEPGRSEGGQRLYSDLDIARLRVLHQLTGRGHAIGRLARLSLQELEQLAREDLAPEPASALDAGAAADFRETALRAVHRLDAPALHSALERAAVTLGVPAFLDLVAAPSLHAIGQGWHEGSLGIAHEHLATPVFRRVLGWIMGMYEVSAAAPQVVVATPAGQVHELGAMLAAATAAAEGWGVTYLGADLPAREIVGAARQVDARAVALSLVYLGSETAVLSDLAALRRALPADVTVLVGGAAVEAVREPLEGAGVRVADSLADLRLLLRELGESPRAA
ncbi:MAG TPA: cobalamin-dependent protein [Gemmatimonadales bacterium]